MDGRAGSDSGTSVSTSVGSARLSALVYPIGAMSAGLACLAFMALAHQRGDKRLDFHAKQACILNLITGFVLWIVVFLCFVLYAVYVMPKGRVSIPGLMVRVVLPSCVGCALNYCLNGWLAYRALCGRPIILPVVGKWLRGKTSAAW